MFFSWMLDVIAAVRIQAQARRLSSLFNRICLGFGVFLVNWIGEDFRKQRVTGITPLYLIHAEGLSDYVTNT